MKKYLLKFIVVFLFVFLSDFSTINAQSNGLDVNLNIGGCNNNGICEVGQEDIFSCPIDCTPITPPGGNGGGTRVDVLFKDLKIDSSYNSVIIQWKTNVPVMSSLKWGTNPDYKDGVISNINFLLNHKVEITGLKPGTLYYFSIQAKSNLGKIAYLNDQTFNTLVLPDTTTIGNPTNVKAISNTSGITITWENTKDKNFDYVRVMRNDERFYESTSVGYLVYEGEGMYFTDSRVKEGNKYFYSLFSRDKMGNYSSGSMISIIHNPSNLDKYKEPIVGPVIEKVNSLSNIFIIKQNEISTDFNPGGNFSLNGDDPIIIKTNYSPKVINNDMWLEIRNYDGVIIAQYFFSRIKDKDGFVQVVIPYFIEEGNYNITVYKYNNKVSELVNYGSFEISKILKQDKPLSFLYIFWIIIFTIFILLLLFLLFFIILPKIFKYFKKDKVVVFVEEDKK